MPRTAENDELVMRLVESALATPPEEREAYLRRACEGDTKLFDETWTYVLWEQRMNGFLREPMCPRPDGEHPFGPGDLLDSRFRIVREVAQGGMGIVYEARDQKLDRRIALKCAKLGFGKRLPPEVRNASEISHPNVCKIFEIHTTSTERGQIDFLTMEFLDGETLTERLSRGPLPHKEAQTIALQICAGLAEAHRNQVIHGDLKSNNVFVTRAADGRIRSVITDFGLARRPEATQHAVQSVGLVGTPDYMAPELWEGKKASVTSDIYALGVILHELACGQRPKLQSEQRHVRKLAPVHPKWDRILQRCLDPDPLKRFQRVDELSRALAPRDTRLWFMASAAAALLAIASGLVTYETATAPEEFVRLAMLPLESTPNNDPLADTLSRDIGAQLTRLKGSPRTELTIIPPRRVVRNKVDTAEKAKNLLGATHVLRVKLRDENGNLTVQAFLTDVRSQAIAREWKAVYAPGEVRYLPVALAGMVTGTFRLPILPSLATVNPVAREDYLRGLEYVRRDSGVDAALECMQRAVAADPDSPLTYAGLAEAQWFKYHLTKKHTWLEKVAVSGQQAERRNPDLAPVLRIVGLLRFDSGLYEQATAMYLRAIELEPNQADAHRRLGMAYEASDRLEDALASYRRAVELEPAYYRNHQALGAFFFQRANYGEAIKHLTKTIDLAPQESSAHFALGSTYVNLGRFTEGEKELRLALLPTETPSALHALGLVLMYQGKDQDAIPYILRAANAMPDRYLWWIHLGTSYRRTGSAPQSEMAYRQGLDLVEKEVMQHPRDGAIRSHLAYICAGLGDRRRADSEIAQALQFSPNDADVRWWAALTYELSGKRDATLAVLSASPNELVEDLSRWPEVADLQKDPRFQDLLGRHQVR